jgi:hypothetical protein
MKQIPLDSFSVKLNRETWDLLVQVRTELGAKLGFEPTNGQVVRHLIAIYFGEASNV